MEASGRKEGDVVALLSEAKANGAEARSSGEINLPPSQPTTNREQR